MEDVIKIGLGFVVLAVMFVIGGAVVVQTNSTTESLVLASDSNKSHASYTLWSNLTSNNNSAIQTFTGFLPVLAIAAVGGVALVYILGFLGSASRQ